MTPRKLGQVLAWIRGLLSAPRRLDRLEAEMPGQPGASRQPPAPAEGRRMTARELAARLTDLHRREKSIAALLFGIEYARDIEECRNLMGLSRNAAIREIVQFSGIPSSYTVNVDKGIRMAPYVSVQRRPPKQAEASC